MRGSKETITVKPLISIVVPNKNGAKYLKQCLDSIVSQDYANKEIIVVDGYSDDGSWDIIKSYSGIVALQAEPKGEPDALNVGMKFAHGDILTFLDSDDYYPPYALSIVGQYFTTHNVAWAYGLGDVVDANNIETRKLMMAIKTCLMRRYDYDILCVVNYLLQPSVYWRRELWENIGGFRPEEKYAFEYEWWLRAGKKFTPGFIDKYIGVWRMHGDSVTSSNLKQNAIDALRLQREYTNNIFIKSAQQLSYWVTRAIYSREKR